MTSRWLRIGCDFRYLAEIATPVIFQVQPRDTADIALRDEQWSPEPAMDIHSYTDLYGNPCTRAVLPVGKSSFRYDAVAIVPDATEDADHGAPECAPDELPDDTLIYILPSRYCLPDVLGKRGLVARFGALPTRTMPRVQAICDHVLGAARVPVRKLVGLVDRGGGRR